MSNEDGFNDYQQGTTADVEKVDGADEELETLARKMQKVRSSKDDLNHQLDDVKAEEAMIKARLKDLMERREMTKFHVKGVGLVYFQTGIYPKVQGDPTDLVKWLDEHEGTDVAPRTISKDRLKEYFEGRLADDKEVPPSDMVEMRTGQEVRFRPDHKMAAGG